MNSELWQRIEHEGGVIDLSTRTKLCLTGADRVRYLNGQVTNDVRTANASTSLYACVTDAKGRIAGDVCIRSAGDALWIDAEPPLRETLAARLERYIVADDVVLTDVTDNWRLWHVFGAAVPSVAGLSQAIVSNRLGLPGIDVWQQVGDLPPALDCPLVDERDFETLRVLRGIPRWPNELNADTFPQEAGIEGRAMSYAKGCYIGQEILSRIRSTGRMPRDLAMWRATEAAPAEITVDAELFLGDKVVGRVTSVARHPVTGLTQGLAFVKQGSAPAHSILLARTGPPSIAASLELTALVK